MIMSSILSTVSITLCRRCMRTSACLSTNARSTSCRRRMSGVGVGAIASLRQGGAPSSTSRTSLLNRRTSWHPYTVETAKASLNSRISMRRPWPICASRTLARPQCQSTRLLMIRSLRLTWKSLLGLRSECEEAVPARRAIPPCTPHATPTLR